MSNIDKSATVDEHLEVGERACRILLGPVYQRRPFAVAGTELADLIGFNHQRTTVLFITSNFAVTKNEVEKAPCVG